MHNENTNDKTRKPRAAAAPEATVTLTPAQLEKLWAIVIGGRLTLHHNGDGQISAAVSLGSFAQALPILIDRL